MKFNPITKEIFTDNGQFIKKMACPYLIQWDNLDINSKNKTARNCSQCNHPIMDTSFFNDKNLLSMISENPNTCFKINLNQENLTIQI